MKKLLTIVLILIVYAEPNLLGQVKGRGTIEGRITNSKTNEPVPFATLFIWGTTIGSVSDLDGNFKFTGIAPGYVQLSASSVGFEEYLTEKFLVTVANTAYIEIAITETDIAIDEVVIKASPFRKNEESPLSLQRIEIEQIEKNPGGNRDISKVIQSLPGVASSVSFRNDIIVRGGGPNENSFYLDGVEIPTINHFATQGSSGGPVGIINVDFIREINFYSGAFPSNLSNSLSSVMYLRQKDGNPEKLKTKASLGSSDLALTLDGPISNNTTFMLSARRSYLQFLFAALELPFLPTYNDFQFKSRTKLNEKNEIILIGLGALDDFELNLDANETPEQKYLLSTLPVNKQWNYTFGAIYKHYGNYGYSNLIISRNHLNNTSYKYPNNDESQAKLLDYVSEEIENKVRYERNLIYKNKLKVIIGGGLNHSSYTNSTKTQVYNKDLAIDRIYETDIKNLQYSFFTSASKPLIKGRLILSAGIRLEGNNYSSEMNNPLKQFSPRISASYLLTKKLSINVNTGRYYQKPPYTTMGYKANNGILINKVNNLGYLQNDQLVFGFELKPNNKSVISIEGFLKNYSNYLFSERDSVPLSSKGVDFGVFGAEEVKPLTNGRAYGFEVLGRSQDIWGFNTILSYTFVRSEFKDLRAKYYGEYLPSSWDNQHLLNLTGTRSFKGNWYLGYKWRLVGGAPYTPYDKDKSSIKAAWDVQAGPYLDYSKFNELRFSTYHQLDIRIDKEFYFNKWSLNLYLDIQNIYNSKSETQGELVRKSFIDPNYNDIKLDENNIERYELEELESTGSGTILPTLGIIVEF